MSLPDKPSELAEFALNTIQKGNLIPIAKFAINNNSEKAKVTREKTEFLNDICQGSLSTYGARLAARFGLLKSQKLKYAVTHLYSETIQSHKRTLITHDKSLVLEIYLEEVIDLLKEYGV